MKTADIEVGKFYKLDGRIVGGGPKVELLEKGIERSARYSHQRSRQTGVRVRVFPSGEERTSWEARDLVREWTDADEVRLREEAERQERGGRVAARLEALGIDASVMEWSGSVRMDFAGVERLLELAERDG